MSCLDNVIGLKDSCGSWIIPSGTASDSGLALNNLPGISVKEIDATYSEEYESGVEFVTEMITEGIEEIKTEIRSRLLPQFNLASVVEGESVGKYKSDMPTQAAQAYLVGIRVKVPRNEYLKFHLGQIKLMVQSSTTVSVVVWDLQQNKLLDTISVTTTADEITSQDVYKTYGSEGQKLDLFIGYDATSLGSYETSFVGSCTNCNNTFRTKDIIFSGKKILSASDKIADNLENQTGSSGLSLTYSLNCDFDYLFCTMKSSIAVPLRYKVGAKIMEQMKYSKRLNSIINVFAAEAGELYEFFDDQYQQRFEDILHNVKLPENSCFRCNQRVRTAVNLP